VANLKAKMTQFLQSQKEGEQYETGIAIRQASKEAKILTSQQHRNPIGTPKSMLRCPYWHKEYCNKYGHKLATHKDCFMYRKSKEEREAARDKIRDDHIECELLNFDTKDNRHTDTPIF
jgi:hypothetical protein